jgi:hypothetical protein
MFNAPERLSAPTSANSSTAIGLGAWFHRGLNLPQGRVHTKLRGNHLYLLCEAQICPDRAAVLPQLHKILADPQFQALLTHQAIVIHRFIVYGRQVGMARPAWAETIEWEEAAQPSAIEPSQPQFGQLEAQSHHQSSQSHHQSSQSGQSISQPANPSADPLSAALSSAALRPPFSTSEAKAIGIKVDQHLSSLLSQYGVSVRSKLKPLTDEKSPIPNQTVRYRLWILCEAVYSLDAELVAESIAQHLRKLALAKTQGAQVQDAIVSSQVQGETRPDWLLRVDLTPAETLLEEWARWGETQAIARLLNHALREQQVRFRVSAEGSTLHLHCLGREVAPPQVVVVERVAQLLTAIAPQGYHAASLYGLAPQTHNQAPDWLHWIALPAAEDLSRADSTEGKAQQGDWAAIAHLLTRRLNPDLKRFLSTGGTRLQVRQRDSVLHIMVDAPIALPQRATVATVTQVLQSLNVEGITGLCLYGRRSGQTQPLWKSGVDLAQPKARPVPEAVPEFAATDAYVGDLLSPAGALVWVPSKEKRDWRRIVEAVTTTTQTGLLRSHLFSPLSQTQPLQRTTAAIGQPSLDGRIALVWAALGICLTISTDWGLGLVSRRGLPLPNGKPTVVTQTVEMPQLNLNKSQGNKSRGNPETSSVFNSSGFTQGNNGAAIVSHPQQDAFDRVNYNPNLIAAALQPKALLEDAQTPYADLNVEQLEERLALYQKVVQQSGVPDVLVIGSSRALRGIDPTALQDALTQEGYSNVRVFNFGINGATAQLVDLVLRRMIPADQLPKLIIWADGARAFNSGRVDVTFNAIATSPGYQAIPAIARVSANPEKQAKQPAAPEPEVQKPINERLAQAYEALEQKLSDWTSKLSAAYPDRQALRLQVRDRLFGSAPAQPAVQPSDTVGSIPEGGKGLIDVNGFLPLSVRFNPVTYYQKHSRVSGAFDGDYESFKLSGKQQDALRSLTRYLNQKQVHLVFVNLPLTTEYLDNTRRQHETTFQQQMMQAATQQKFIFRNLTETLKAKNDFFSDPSHLNRYGAYVVAQQLAKDALIPWQVKALPKPTRPDNDAIVRQLQNSALPSNSLSSNLEN